MRALDREEESSYGFERPSICTPSSSKKKSLRLGFMDI